MPQDETSVSGPSEAEVEAAAREISPLAWARLGMADTERSVEDREISLRKARAALTAAAQVRAQEETAVLDSYAAENQRLSDERDEWKHKWMALAQASLLVGTMHAPDEPDALGIRKGE